MSFAFKRFIRSAVAAALMLASVLAVAADTAPSSERSVRIAAIDTQIHAISGVLRANEWSFAYRSYREYRESKEQLEEIHARIEGLQAAGDPRRLDEISRLLRQSEALAKKVALLDEYKKGAFDKLIKLPDLPAVPTVRNPFSLVSAFSYLKSVDDLNRAASSRLAALNDVLDAMEKERELLQSKRELIAAGKAFRPLRHETDLQIERQAEEIAVFHEAKQRFTNVATRYEQQIDKQTEAVRHQIRLQVEDLLFLGAALTVLIIVSVGLKALLKNVVKDDEMLYSANKAITITTFIVGLLIVLFVYIDDVSSLVTILGFASAGLAIAMKDWFMSLFGWLVLLVSGIVKVGDRIKVSHNGEEILGDVLDISPIRITLYEDITLLSYTRHKRAGRIVFLPNNMIFTDMIVNYSHAGLKTVWDTIEVVITFDSNHKKAAHIIKEIARKYSKGYTDLTRKQFGRLRDRYSLKNTNAESRVFTFIEPYGLKISMWYLTNAFATLPLKSTISAEIVDAFAAEEDIRIAYPTQSIMVGGTTTGRPAEAVE